VNDDGPDQRTSYDSQAVGAGGTAPWRAALVGTRLADRYDILELIGAGGMGEVYRARDRELDELVALKVIRADLANDAVLIERFRHEVKLARRVTHRNVARTFELGRAGGVVFCTMELIAGEALTGRLGRGALAVGEAVAIARAVCEGLAAAHAVGVIHRDVKPDNILLAVDGRVVVADFGVAAAAVDGAQGLSGTVAYMAPEQALGDPPSPLADVYAVGVVLHEMVTGQRAFAGPAGTILDAKHTVDHVVTPVAGEVTAELAAVIAAATAREPSRRTPSGKALRDALAPWLVHAEMPAPVRVRAGAAVAEHVVTVVAPPPLDPARDHLVRALHDALLGRLLRAPRLRVHARTITTGEHDDHVVALAGDGTLTMRRGGAPLLELALPLAVDKIAGAAELAAAAVVAAVGLADPGVADRAGPGYELWLRARHITQNNLATHRQAVDLLEQALRLAPDDPRILSTLAMTHVRRAFFDPDADAGIVARASTLARAALASGPDVAEAHLAIGHLELNVGDPVAAAGHFRVAIARAPQLAEAHEYLGRMLLEANYIELARVRLGEAIAIAPHVMSPRWELARAHALAGQWAEYDRVVEELGASSSSRAVALARFAIWRGDPELVRRTRATFGNSDGALAPMLMPWMYELFLDPSRWPAARAPILEVALDMRSPNRRRRVFLAQLVAEVAAKVGDVEVAIRCIHHAVDNGLFDLAWLERCPLVAPVASLPELANAAAKVRGRAEAILDALYGDHDLRTAKTVLAV
jgi:serine/threonine-protein kinase